MLQKQKSDLSRAFSEDGALKTHVGGQALIEGIMMRGKFNWAVAVREPAGSIYTEEHDLASGRSKNSWLRLPVIRGVTAFVESLALGYKALEIAAIHAFDDSSGTPSDADSAGSRSEVRIALESGAISGTREVIDSLDSSGTPSDTDSAGSRSEVNNPSPCSSEREFSWKRDFGNPDTVIDGLGAQRTLEVVSEGVKGQLEPTAQGTDKPVKAGQGTEFGHTEMVISMALGLVLGIVLFIVAPAFITNLIVGEYDQHTLAWNLVDGILRVAVFIFYIWLIGRMKDIQRMFGYHGAEHKAIHCYEHGLTLTPENARSFPRLHVRCGTAFLIMVMVIAIIVYTLTPLNALIEALGVADGAPKLILVILVRILLMPLIAGISYEITVKWAGSHPDSPLVKVVLWPGMQMQYLTTREPDDGQIECAISAMRMVLEREEAEAIAGNTTRAN